MYFEFESTIFFTKHPLKKRTLKRISEKTLVIIRRESVLEYSINYAHRYE